MKIVGLVGIIILLLSLSSISQTGSKIVNANEENGHNQNSVFVKK